jgi:pimeloyl-ACP methyl ester carboxylesterase
MPHPNIANAVEYIAPLNMNGLQGRVLSAPTVRAHKKREILLIYGHHALLERWWGLVENLREYGAVTMPDLPGFGGMQSFRQIGKEPTIDNFADYLAAFVRMRYKKKRITIVAISFGFVVATRMLQRYPDIAKKVDLLVSLVGFMHADDFRFNRRNQKMVRALCRFISTRPVSFLFRYVGLNGPIIKAVYARLPAGKRRLSSMDPLEAKEMLDFDVQLWQLNDVSTHWRTTAEFLAIDNCRTPVPLPVWHVGSNNDHYLNNDLVKQHMLVTFQDCTVLLIDAKAHTPNLLGDKTELGILLPSKLRRALSK